MNLEDKLKKILDEKERIAIEESALREEAMSELLRIEADISNLEERKIQIENFLGIEDSGNRAGHGQILQLCIKAVSENAGGLTSSQVKDLIASENPGLKLSSVPATMSRLATQGRLRRDETGRYFVA